MSAFPESALSPPHRSTSSLLLRPHRLHPATTGPRLRPGPASTGLLLRPLAPGMVSTGPRRLPDQGIWAPALALAAQSISLLVIAPAAPGPYLPDIVLADLTATGASITRFSLTA